MKNIHVNCVANAIYTLRGIPLSGATRLLYEAVKENNMHKARFALRHNADVHRQFGFCKKSLLQLCKSEEMACLLLDCGGSPFRYDLFGNNAMCNKNVRVAIEEY